MTASKALESWTRLILYCRERYDLKLTSRHASQLVASATTFHPVDPDVWLKVQLIQLHLFPAGCTQPPEIRFTVLLHMSWPTGKGIILLPVFQEARHQGTVVDCRVDRHRGGHAPWKSDGVYDGVIKRTGFSEQVESKQEGRAKILFQNFHRESR